MIGLDAYAERRQIVRHLKEAATRILSEAMYQPGRYDLKTAEIAATALEEAAGAIAEGDHWRLFDEFLSQSN